MARKDKGISKPKRPADPIVTPDVFRKYTREEKEKAIINLANRLNRRLARLEKHGLTESQAYKQAIKRADEIKPDAKRFSKSVKGKTERQLEAIYRKMAKAAQIAHTKITAIKEFIKAIGTSRKTGKTFLTFKDYTQLTPEEQKAFWDAFHRMQDAMGPRFGRGTKGSADLVAEVWEAYTDEKEPDQSPADVLRNIENKINKRAARNLKQRQRRERQRAELLAKFGHEATDPFEIDGEFEL